MAASIKYRKLTDYKYQLMEKYVHETQWLLAERVATSGGWTALSKTGKLTVKKGYAWDGPSGPTIDTPNFMRGSLVHDALYQLMRERLLPGRKRKPADVLLWLICLEDGMSRTRADYVFHAVRAFGGRAARPRQRPEQVIIEAP
ncbi:MAG: hypothetical protein GY723_18790 [bacterium]|nr:hypothetical protein [bacterium]MCP5068354.1 hypothetical protein [bacterium]